MAKNFITPAQAEAYDHWYETPLGRWVDQCEKEAVFSLLPPLQGLRILDAGCGTGNFTLELAARGAEVVGVDHAAAMLRRAQAKTRQPQARITWILGNLAPLPFASQSFDGALVILALDFIEARAPVMQELSRVVRPGGFLVAAALNRHSLFTLKRKVRAWFKPSLWGGVDFLRAADLAHLLKQTGVFHEFAWRRAVYCPPVNSPWFVKLGPLWERLGARLIPGAAAFLVVAAQKRGA
jgi:ubiquinone/menaquinone biosynthesis C-methylase UbiE